MSNSAPSTTSTLTAHLDLLRSVAATIDVCNEEIGSLLHSFIPDQRRTGIWA